LNSTHSRANSQFRFYLSAITRTNNTNWWDINFYSRPDPPYYSQPSQTEIDMTNELAIDPAHAFNVYVSRLISDYGWVIYFPWDVSEDSKLNGVIIDYRTLPDGEFSGYNYGYTLVHEGGHYLGLYHTFQNGCTAPGDEVDDTPYQADGVNIFECNDLLDTCPYSPGFDPVHNYMNYTDDPCYNQFTEGQMERVSAIMGQYRPNLGGTTLVFISTYTLGNNSSLKIFPAMTLQFTSGSSLIVNGTLTANGSSASTPITFDFGSPNSSTQNGIRFNSGSSGTINYCRIRNAYRGIYENNVSINISNSAISNCTDGIYLYGSSPWLQYCNIHDNSNSGLNLVYSSPLLQWSNYIHNNYDGVFCSSSSNPKFGQGIYSGENDIRNNSYGVVCINNACPMLGNTSPTDGGYNNLVNVSYNVFNMTSNVIYARENWWGTTDPNNFKNVGTVSYSPYRSAELYIPQPPLSKKSGNSIAQKNEDIPMISELDKAYQLIADSNFAEARNICMNLVTNYPDYNVSFNALNLLKDTYNVKDITGKKNIYASLFNNKDKKNIHAMAGLIMADVDKENRLKHIDDVLTKYGDDNIAELALFNKFVYFYFEKEDMKSALAISGQLDKQFPKSQGSIEAHKILGDKEYFNIPPKQENAQPETNTQLSKEFKLYGNYPNPFNPTTTIKYQLSSAGFITLKVYDMLGREIQTLVNGYKDKRYYEVSFDASDKNKCTQRG